MPIYNRSKPTKSTIQNHNNQVDNSIKTLVTNYSSTQQTIDNLHREIQNVKQLIVITNKLLVAPANAHTAFVTLIGGGGVGGHSHVNNGMLCAGGGGGGGSVILSYAISLNKTTDHTLRIQIGAGGTPNSPDGTATRVTIVYPSGSYTLIANGGLGASGNTGGAGGTSKIELDSVHAGHNGSNGQVILPSQGIASGGLGGSTYFTVCHIDTQNGSYGTGGVGSDSGSSTVGNGSNGCVVVSYAFLP